MTKLYKVDQKRALRMALKSLQKFEPELKAIKARRGEVLNFAVNFRVGRKRDAVGATRSCIIQAAVGSLIASGIYTVDDIIIDLNRHLPKRIYYEQEIIDALTLSGIENPIAHLDYILTHSQFYATAIGH